MVDCTAAMAVAHLKVRPLPTQALTIELGFASLPPSTCRTPVSAVSQYPSEAWPTGLTLFAYGVVLHCCAPMPQTQRAFQLRLILQWLAPVSSALQGGSDRDYSIHRGTKFQTTGVHRSVALRDRPDAHIQRIILSYSPDVANSHRNRLFDSRCFSPSSGNRSAEYPMANGTCGLRSSLH